MTGCRMTALKRWEGLFYELLAYQTAQPLGVVFRQFEQCPGSWDLSFRFEDWERVGDHIRRIRWGVLALGHCLPRRAA